MTLPPQAVRPTSAGAPVALLRAAHPGPALAVTVLGAALAIAGDLAPDRVVLVTAAVLAGQLSIGWSNDVIDVRRDRLVSRSDKPLANGEVSIGLVRRACVGALVATVILSLLTGTSAGLVHLGCVAAAWGYNLGLKSTPLSWLPYAVAFAGLPTFVSLAGPGLPAVWVPIAGGLLGVGAHLLNVLPDLADDAQTGVRGLPHRLGERWTPPVSVALLVLASVVIAIGTDRLPAIVLTTALAIVVALGTLAVLLRGRAPFRAAIGIAFVDVVMLVMGR